MEEIQEGEISISDFDTPYGTGEVSAVMIFVSNRTTVGCQHVFQPLSLVSSNPVLGEGDINLGMYVGQRRMLVSHLERNFPSQNVLKTESRKLASRSKRGVGYAWVGVDNAATISCIYAIIVIFGGFGIYWYG